MYNIYSIVLSFLGICLKDTLPQDQKETYVKMLRAAFFVIAKKCQLNVQKIGKLFYFMILATYFKKRIGAIMYVCAAIYVAFFHVTLKPSIFSMPLNILFLKTCFLNSCILFIYMDGSFFTCSNSAFILIVVSIFPYYMFHVFKGIVHILPLSLG